MNTIVEIILAEAKKYSGAFRESVFQIFSQKIIRNCKSNLEKEVSIMRLRKILLPYQCPECDTAGSSYHCSCSPRGV
jgi:hypothetical protein